MLSALRYEVHRSIVYFSAIFSFVCFCCITAPRIVTILLCIFTLLTIFMISLQVNMRERLDYSCALFGPDGGLVANAPHIPVHLGAMQDAVRFQLLYWGNDIADGTCNTISY